MNLAERMKIVPLLMSLDVTTGLNTASVNMKNFHRATFICLFGANTAGAGYVLQVYSALATATRTTALAVRYAWGSAAVGSASCDVLGATAVSATSGVVVGDSAHDSTMLVIDLMASELPTNHNWVTLYPNAGTAGAFHCIAILEPRYGSNVSPTALL